MKILRFAQFSILSLALLSVFGWSVYHVHTGGKSLGVLTKPIQKFSEFPQTASDVISEIISPEMFYKIDPNFEEFNELDYDLYAVNSVFEKNNWVTKLTNLKNDDLLFEWTLDNKEYNSRGRIFSHAEPYMPIILPDTSVILNPSTSWNLYRLDSKSNIVWHNTEYIFHHGMNLDAEGNIWTGTRENTVIENGISYKDDCLTKIDVKTGKTLFHKSLSTIFRENNMSYLTHGYKNNKNEQDFNNDPFHLNDVQPALTDTKYWKKDDLFVSIRNRSMIFIYRPSTNKVTRIIQGPFYNQHDVDITSDSTMIVFNNNVSGLRVKKGKVNQELDYLKNQKINRISEVIQYNFNDSTFISLYPEEFEKNEVFTDVQGLQEQLSNGDLFVESNREAKVYIFNKNKTKLKRYFNKPVDGKTQYPHWVRVYENLKFLK